MEVWQIAVSAGGVLTPVILAAMARDRTLFTMIGSVKADVSKVKTEVGQQIKSAVDPVHERINRVRDEFVRRDDLEGHLNRWEKQFDDLRAEMRRNNENLNTQLSEIAKLLRKS